jgi:hypothetical protein
LSVEEEKKRVVLEIAAELVAGSGADSPFPTTTVAADDEEEVAPNPFAMN